MIHGGDLGILSFFTFFSHGPNSYPNVHYFCHLQAPLSQTLDILLNHKPKMKVSYLTLR